MHLILLNQVEEGYRNLTNYFKSIYVLKTTPLIFGTGDYFACQDYLNFRQYRQLLFVLFCLFQLQMQCDIL